MSNLSRTSSVRARPRALSEPGSAGRTPPTPGPASAQHGEARTGPREPGRVSSLLRPEPGRARGKPTPLTQLSFRPFRSVQPLTHGLHMYVSSLIERRLAPSATTRLRTIWHRTFCFSRCRMASFIDRRSRAATQTTPVHEETVKTSLPVSVWVAVGLPACARYVMNSLPSVGTWRGRP